jgi:hypothetical protein
MITSQFSHYSHTVILLHTSRSWDTFYILNYITFCFSVPIKGKFHEIIHKCLSMSLCSNHEYIQPHSTYQSMWWHCATNWKVTGLIPNCVIGIFH